MRYLFLAALFAAASSAAQTPVTWALTEELRIGSDAGPASFVRVAGIAPTKGGNIFVLEEKAQEIRVFDASGKFLRLAARRGRGPGEIINATGLAVDPSGNVWTSGDEYVVYRGGLESQDSVAVIRSTAAQSPVSRTEREAVIAELDSLFARYPRRDVDYSRIPATKPAIHDLFVDDVGNVWVQRSGAGAANTEFDVWSADGRQIATARLPVRLKTDLLAPLVIGNALYAVAIDEDDVPYVVRARIRR